MKDNDVDTDYNVVWRRRFRRRLSTFFANTTFHGIDQCISASNWTTRLFWIFTIFTVFFAASYQLYNLIIHFNSNPTVTSIDVKYPEDKGIGLPPVTLCILCKMNKTRVEQTYPKMTPFLAEFGMTSFWSAYSTALMDLNYFDAEVFGRNKTFEDVEEEMWNATGHRNTSKLLIDSAFSCDSMFLMCWFENGHVFDCCDPDNPYMTIKPLLAHSGSCFEFAPKRSQRLPGPVGGFGFVFWYPREHFYNTAFNSYNEHAVHMYMSPMDAMLENNPLSLPIGYHSHVNLQAVQSVRQKEDVLGYTLCEEPKLKYFDNYTYQSCQVECLVNTLLDRCNCTGVHYYGKLPKTQICSPVEAMDCYKLLAANFSYLLINCRKQHCTEACDYWTYRATLTISRVFHPCCVEEMSRYWRIPETDPFQSLIIGDIFFGDIQYQRIQQNSALTFETFVSSIGGAMGLWTGASIITWIHLIFSICSFCCTKRPVADAIPMALHSITTGTIRVHKPKRLNVNKTQEDINNQGNENNNNNNNNNITNNNNLNSTASVWSPVSNGRVLTDVTIDNQPFLMPMSHSQCSIRSRSQRGAFSPDRVIKEAQKMANHMERNSDHNQQGIWSKVVGNAEEDVGTTEDVVEDDSNVLLLGYKHIGSTVTTPTQHNTNSRSYV